MEILKNKYTSDKFLFNDKKMFEFIFKAYFPRLMAFANKFIPNRDDAEDIIQGVFLKVWEKRKEIEEDTFQSYLFTLVRNACLNYLKHQKIVDSNSSNLEEVSKTEALYYADFFSDPFHQTIYNEIQNEIEKVMEGLPEQTRKVFHLSRFKGMKNSEIAKMLNISVRTIEKHNTRALQKLKKHLSNHYLYAIVVIDLLRAINELA